MDKEQIEKELKAAGLINGGVNNLDDLGKLFEVLGRAEILKDMKITVNSKESEERLNRFKERLQRIKTENGTFKFS